MTLERVKPTLNMNADIFANGEVYNHTEIDAPFFTTKTPGADMSPDQAKFRTLTNEAMDHPVKSRWSRGAATAPGRRPSYSGSPSPANPSGPSS